MYLKKQLMPAENDRNAALVRSVNQAVNGENKHQPIASEGISILNSKSVGDFKNVI